MSARHAQLYMQHRSKSNIFCFLHIYNFNVLLQALKYWYIKGVALSCLVQGFLAWPTLKQLAGWSGSMRLFLEYAFGNLSTSIHQKYSDGQGKGGTWKTRVDMRGNEIKWKDGLCQWNKNYPQWVAKPFSPHPPTNQFSGLHSHTFCPIHWRLDWFEACSKSRISKKGV